MRRQSATLLVLLLLPVAVRADWWIETGRGYQSIGGARRLGPYASRAQAEQVNREYFNGQASIDGSDDSPGAEPARGGSTGDPAVDMMMPLLQQGASLFGEALGRAIFGDPAEKARRAAQEAAQRQSDRRFQNDMAAKRDAESEHLREERHRKILRGLKRLSDGAVWDSPSPGELDAVDLRPGGASFFGLGGGRRGGAEPAHNDPMVVDLRHLRRGAWISQKAAQAPPEDAQLLQDQALQAARGGRDFLQVPDDALPAVSEQGLLAFQKSSADYAQANDFRAKVARHEQETLRAAELSFQAANQARDDYEAARASGAPPEELEAKRLKAEGLFADAGREREAWQKSHEASLSAQTAAAVSWADTRKTLGAVSAGRDPAVDPFEKTPPSGVDAKAWTSFQEEMIASRKAAEAERALLLKDLPPPPPPDAAPKVHIHEGVILGTFGSERVADEMAREGRSPFTGKTYQEMNQSAFWNRPGEQGALVAGFGTPEDATAHGVQEAGRVLGDHFSRGHASLQTPQAQQAIEKLEGKSFDRLVAHSNGSPIALALIERGSIQVNELHVVGGDRALTDARYLQNLIDRGKVKRVVVWTHTNDPIPLGTSLIPVRTDEHQLLAEHVARKATGTAEGGDSKVKFIFSKGEGEGLVGPHFLQGSYYPDMAKTYGVPWTPPSRRP